MAKRKSVAAEGASTEGSFEESLNELQMIVAELEEGSLGLEAALSRFERGVGLLRKCHRSLEAAEKKIEVLMSAAPASDEDSLPSSSNEVEADSYTVEENDPEDGAADRSLPSSGLF